MASTIPTRLLLFQFLLLFSYYHYRTLTKSSYIFKDHIKDITSMYPQKIPKIDQALKKPEKAFQAFLIINVTLAITSILGFRLSQILAGFVTMSIAIVYCNPLKTIMTNFKRNPMDGAVNYLPSVEFLGLFALSLGMIANAFLEAEKKRTPQEETPTSK